MATSIRDLAQLLTAEARLAAISPAATDEAVAALAHLGRALARLADDGLDDSLCGPRESMTRDLAAACRASASTTECGGGRTSTLAGALADVVARQRPQLDREQRWALATTVADTVRVITIAVSEPATRPAADIAWTHLCARTVCLHALCDPPRPAAHRALDRAVPATTAPDTMTPGQLAAESLTAIAHRLQRVDAGQVRPPTLLEVFAITRAAESTARYAAAVTAATGHPPADPAGAAAWHDVRAALQPFTAAAPTTGQDGDITVWARRTHTGLRHELGPPAPTGPTTQLAPDAVALLGRMVNELPGIADSLTKALRGLADAGDLHALASRLPYGADRLPQFLTHRPVIADRFDLDQAILHLTRAGDRSAELAIAVHQTLGTGGDQPGLLAAHTDRAHTAAHRDQTVATRWAALAAAIHPGIVTDPHWPALAAQLDRIHATGGDVPVLLALATADRPLPDLHPARSLDYRLVTATPTFAHRPTLTGNTHPTVRPPAPPPPAPPRPAPSPRR